jgi:hypothetical protein
MGYIIANKERTINMELGKPQSGICSKCFIINNKLCCMTCKYKTKEWVAKCKAISPIMLLGEYDNFKEIEEKQWIKN